MNFLERVGTAILNGLAGAGGTICLVGKSIYWCKASIRNRSKIVHQMDVAGVGSLPVVGLVAVFSGILPP